MVRRIFLVIFIGLTLIVGTNSFAVTKSGSLCKKAGSTTVLAGKKYTCIKIGKKLVWNKGVLLKKNNTVIPDLVSPTPTPTPTPSSEAIKPIPTPTAPSNVFDPSQLPINLSQPEVISQNILSSNLIVKFKVDSKATGGYIEIKELNLDGRQTLTKKDFNNVVEITREIPDSYKEPGLKIFLYAYSETGRSSCCYSIDLQTNRGLTKKTQIYSGLDLFEYQAPIKITTKPTYALSEKSKFSNLTPCRLKDGDPILDNMTIGFPLPPGRTDQTKPVEVVVLGADFPDVSSITKPADDYRKAISTMKHFWESQASNGLVIDVKVSQSYKRMSKSIYDYKLGSTLNGFNGENYWDFIQQVIDAYDSEFDFSGVSTIAVVVPLQVTREQLGTWVVQTQSIFKTKEGPIYNVMITGNGESKASTGAWVHEYGHALGLTDMRYVNSQNAEEQKPEGLGIYDVMGSGSAAAETLVWSRFLTAVLLPSQIHCVTSGEASTHWLIPISQQLPDLKGVVIPLNEYKAIVVESRRNYGYDRIGSDAEGALVYTMDTRIPYRRSPAFIVSPARSTDLEWYTDSALKLGESVTTNGWKITVVETGDFGDVVKVEKVG